MSLTKSDYLLFLNHPAWLWLKKYDKGKLPEIDENTQRRFDTGKELEKYAEALFEGGFRLGFTTDEEYLSLGSRTKETIAQGHQVLFQPRFDIEDLTCLPDIIVFTSEKTLKLYEIKSSTKVKPEHETDLAFQSFVLERCGYMVETVSVIHVNNTYVRDGAIDPAKLLTSVDVTGLVKAKHGETKANIELALVAIANTTIPDISPRHCGAGVLQGWLTIYRTLTEVPAYSIYDLCGLNTKMVAELEDMDVLLIADIPDSVKLNAKQTKLVAGVKANLPEIDKSAITDFLATLTYPLYFYDYETCHCTVPAYDGTRPFQQIPCQYSLHRQEVPGGEVLHTEFIHRGSDNPAPALAEALRKDIGDTGTAIVWNATFEKTRNIEMAEMLPEYSEFFHDLNARTVDLMIPFSKGMFVHPAFLGSASIKSILPILVPELSYKELSVQEGLTAQRLWMEATLEGKGTDEEKEKLFSDLLAYCKLDTLAMVKIYEYLRQIVES
jgi:hypothetical protein